MLPAGWPTLQHDCSQCRQYAVTVLHYVDKGYYSPEYSLSPWFASAPMCSGPCNTHSECSHCPVCGTVECRGCECICDSCGNHAAECRCCSECGSAWCSECYCGYQECECECSDEDDEGYYGGDARFGSIKAAPWNERGLQVGPTPSGSVGDIWDIDFDLDLCQALADKYLLAGLAGGVVNHGLGTADDAYLALLRSEAQSALSDLTARLDRTFRGYLDMIIGGELRHHRAAGSDASLRNTGRSEAWKAWHAIRSAGGTQVLRDAVELFEDFNSSSYGGKAWAGIAQTLLDRETGKLPVSLFVEKVVMLEHNGGSLFDKKSFSVSNRMGWGYHDLHRWVLPAHGARNPWPVLLLVASDEVRELFREYWRHASRVKAAIGQRSAAVERVPMQDGYYVREPNWNECHERGMVALKVG